MISTARIAVGDTPVLIDQPEPECGGHTILIANVGQESVYLDGVAATPDNSFELVKKQTVTISVAPDGMIYAVCAAGKPTTVCTLVTHR